jgi:hypothetical protein
MGDEGTVGQQLLHDINLNNDSNFLINVAEHSDVSGK